MKRKRQTFVHRWGLQILSEAKINDLISYLRLGTIWLPAENGLYPPQCVNYNTLARVLRYAVQFRPNFEGQLRGALLDLADLVHPSKLSIKQILNGLDQKIDLKFYDAIPHLPTLSDLTELTCDSFKPYLDGSRTEETQPEGMDEKIVYDVIPHLQKFFKVPTKMPSFEEENSVRNLNQNAILAAFLDLQLQIWYSESNNRYWAQQRCACLCDGLKYLLAFLGDTPFQCNTHQPLQEDLNILFHEYDTVANEIGIFTYNIFLAAIPIKLTHVFASVDYLLQKIKLLSVKIEQYCTRFSDIPMWIPPGVTIPIDSLFIVDSLLDDIQNLLNCPSHLISDRNNLSKEVFEEPLLLVDMVTSQSEVDVLMDQIKTLFEELARSRTFVRDTELVSWQTENVVVLECFITITGTSYEAEYLIKSKVAQNIPFWYLILRLPTVIQKLEITNSKLQKIKSEYEVSKVTKDFTKRPSLEPKGTTPVIVVGDLLVGFEEEKIKILDELTGGLKSLQIISLVGMPGLGKTTLAKNLFDNSLVQAHFDRHCWCVISLIYDKIKVFKEILACLKKHENDIDKDKDEDKDEDKDGEKLGLRIHQSLKGCRYLIIIDDIWNSSVWDDISRFFPDDNNGSKIMLTTRNKEATPSESIFHNLPLLSDDECLSLLVKKLFRDEYCLPELLCIGKRIVTKCHGLPLAVVVVAGILANLDKNESIWKMVEEKLSKLITDDTSGCMKLLELSFNHLPNHLKLCFLHLGTFSEDSEIAVKKVMWLWIAEGFVQKGEKSQENIAKEYLNDLIDRSLVLIKKRKFDGEIKTCGVHDLLREMCLKMADEELFFKCTKAGVSIYERCSRLRVDYILPPMSRDFGFHCRSFAGHSVDRSEYNDFEMPLLRVMDMSKYSSFCASYPFALRYLSTYSFDPRDCAANKRNFVNLEFLTVTHFVGTIPAFILELVKLRHLNVRVKAILERDPNSCQATTNLKSFSFIYIHDLEDEKILKRFPHLLELKCSCPSTIFPDISSLAELASLKMVFDNGRFTGELTRISFPATIKKLCLRGIGLPWDAMSILGKLPNLQSLKLLRGAFVGDEWRTRDDEFQKLKYLKLDQLYMEGWITCSDHFPQLQCLVLQFCSNLEEIPSDLGNIPTLQKIEVMTTFSDKVSMSAIRIKEEQQEYGNEELEIVISQRYRTEEEGMQNDRSILLDYYPTQVIMRTMTAERILTMNETRKKNKMMTKGVTMPRVQDSLFGKFSRRI